MDYFFLPFDFAFFAVLFAFGLCAFFAAEAFAFAGLFAEAFAFIGF